MELNAGVQRNMQRKVQMTAHVVWDALQGHTSLAHALDCIVSTEKAIATSLSYLVWKKDSETLACTSHVAWLEPDAMPIQACPTVLVQHLFCWLPLRDLASVARVSRSWRQWVRTMPRMQRALVLTEMDKTKTADRFLPRLVRYGRGAGSLFRHICTIKMGEHIQRADFIVPLLAQQLPHLQTLSLRIHDEFQAPHDAWKPFTKLSTCKVDMVQFDHGWEPKVYTWDYIQTLVNQLSQLVTLTNLKLTVPLPPYRCSDSLVQFAPLKQLTQLTAFAFQWQRSTFNVPTCMSNEMVETIASMPALRYLDLFDGVSTIFPVLDAFSAKPHGTIEYIECNLDSVSDENLRPWLERMQKLKTLTRIQQFQTLWGRTQPLGDLHDVNLVQWFPHLHTWGPLNENDLEPLKRCFAAAAAALPLSTAGEFEGAKPPSMPPSMLMLREFDVSRLEYLSPESLCRMLAHMPHLETLTVGEHKHITTLHPIIKTCVDKRIPLQVLKLNSFHWTSEPADTWVSRYTLAHALLGPHELPTLHTLRGTLLIYPYNPLYDHMHHYNHYGQSIESLELPSFNPYAPHTRLTAPWSTIRHWPLDICSGIQAVKDGSQIVYA